MGRYGGDRLYCCSWRVYRKRDRFGKRNPSGDQQRQDAAAVVPDDILNIDYRIHVGDEFVAMSCEIIAEAQGKAKTDN